MKLDSHRPDFAVQSRRQNLNCLSKSDSPQFPTSAWIDLWELPNPFSFDEALLLCQVSEDEWLVWIPDHGEAIINTSKFKIGRAITVFGLEKGEQNNYSPDTSLSSTSCAANL